MRFLLACLLLLSGLTIAAQHRFTTDSAGFYLDGKPFRIISGELHPARIPREYWQHRIRMVKAMGCNTIALYVFWNYHQPVEGGGFDFSSTNHDVSAFIKLCQQEGMWVLLRPGPYVCGEWDFGGLPSWLLRIPDIRIRCADPRYLKAVSGYVKALAAQVKGLQCDHGGPILMMQIENEYGSFGNDRKYLQWLHDLWRNQGITVPFYTADGATPHMLEAGSLPRIVIGLDPGINDTDFAVARRHSNVATFSSETYPGWLTHWGEPFARPDTNELKQQVEYLLRAGRSFNFYVAHGGSNFGYTAGANAFTPVQYQPDITSYDYDAPIDEQGRPRAKYFMLRRLIGDFLGETLPPVPATPPAISVPPFALHAAGDLFSLPAVTHVEAEPKPMEHYGQNQGLIVYSTVLYGRHSGRLRIWEPHDYALVFLNDHFIDTIWRDGGRWEVTLPIVDDPHPRLKIVVEGMGHINFAQFMIDRKGITDRVTLEGMTLMNWEVTLYPMDERFVDAAILKSSGVNDGKCEFFAGSFELDRLGDTFFDLSGYTHGIVLVNGHLLGRYWNMGPQQRLYCPASWLLRGKNKVVVFDLLQSHTASITGYNAVD